MKERVMPPARVCAETRRKPVRAAVFRVVATRYRDRSFLTPSRRVMRYPTRLTLRRFGLPILHSCDFPAQPFQPQLS
jgi:hypothetical protein